MLFCVWSCVSCLRFDVGDADGALDAAAFNADDQAPIRITVKCWQVAQQSQEARSTARKLRTHEVQEAKPPG